MPSSQTVFRALPAGHVHPDGQTCPYCEQRIPNDRAEEIRARFDADAKRQVSALKARMDEQLATERAQLEASKTAEIEKIQQDSAAALEKLKADALQQQTAAREEGKKLAETDAQQKIEAMAAAQEAARNSAAEAERQKVAAVTELSTVKAQLETVVAERTREVRAAMEKSKTDEINALSAKHAQETAKIADQMNALQRRLDTEEGEGADVKLFEVLKAKYPKDEITRVNKTSGADVIHVVKHNKQVCGKIVYDSRNRNAWQITFITKLREDMVTEKADHAILTTSKFPAGVKHIHRCEDVIAANPARVLVLAEILRADIVRSHGQRVSTEDRGRKTEKLYDFIASDAFDKLLGSVVVNNEKLLQLDVDEKKTHNKVWETRGRLMMSSQQLHAKLREQIDGIIGTAETDNA